MPSSREFPFELSIRRRGRESGIEHVLCKATLRAIHGNREVFDAEWNGKAVIVKVFSRGLRSKIRLKREWGGLVKLRQRGLNAPEPMFYGQTADPASPKGYAEASGKWVIAMEKVADAQTLSEIFSKADGKEERAGLLMRVSKELAAQHEKGVMQNDLHLGNFLLNNDGIFAIDPAQVCFFHGPTGRRKSISQLALLTSNFHSEERESVLSVWREYFSRRKWRFGELDERMLWERTSAHKRNWLKHALKKCLRTSKRFLRIENDGYVTVYDRHFVAGTEPMDFARRIDELMEKGEILKRGNTSYVSRLTFNGRDIVVKRYNHKGIFHSIRHTLKGSRAKQSWLYGHRLRCLGIRTPRPVAYIEQRRGMVLWKSYLVTEYVEGQNLYYFLRDEKVSRERRSDMVLRVLEMIERMHKNGITHRDLKPTNILVTTDGPVLTDLDAMKVHKLRWISRWKGRKYLERFRRNAREKCT